MLANRFPNSTTPMKVPFSAEKTGKAKAPLWKNRSRVSAMLSESRQRTSSRQREPAGASTSAMASEGKSKPRYLSP
jgi:hypothetical protein